ncbi:MAG: ATP-grasp domain-containing protein, partial [Planctomycetaceae bacterium]|nr:ATP-grasp domain-containing protein [Planctomycetaceae bacterium]
IAGRYCNGHVSHYEPMLNEHSQHILDVSVMGSERIPPETAAEAREIATAVLERFDVVGVLCIELFLAGDGRLIVNEIAPRPHNSGHLTIEAYNCSQFELQLRTVCGLPPVVLQKRLPAAAMANLLGQHIPETWSADQLSAAAAGDTHLHMYGKTGRRPGRKVGHITAIAESASAAESTVRTARNRLRLQNAIQNPDGLRIHQ